MRDTIERVQDQQGAEKPQRMAAVGKLVFSASCCRTGNRLLLHLASDTKQEPAAVAGSSRIGAGAVVPIRCR